MVLLTCFLPHFPHTLQGRAKSSASSRVVNELQKLRDLALPDLADLLGGKLPADFFDKAPDVRAKREYLYPPMTLFWAFLFQLLNPAMPCQEVVGKIRAWVLTCRDKRGKFISHLRDYGEASHPKYACYYNYKQDFAVHLQNILASTGAGIPARAPRCRSQVRRTVFAGRLLRCEQQLCHCRRHGWERCPASGL